MGQDKWGLPVIYCCTFIKLKENKDKKKKKLSQKVYFLPCVNLNNTGSYISPNVKGKHLSFLCQNNKSTSYSMSELCDAFLFHPKHRWTPVPFLQAVQLGFSFGLVFPGKFTYMCKASEISVYDIHIHLLHFTTQPQPLLIRLTHC